MKILHIGKYYPPFFGGIETFMQDLMEAQIAADSRVQCAALVHHHQAFQPFSTEVINGVKIYRAPILAKALFAPLSPRYGHYLKLVLREFKPDIIHLHMPNTAAFYCLLNAKCRGLPWVIHWHSDVIGENSPWWLRLLYPIYHRVLERPSVEKSQKVIATSPAYAETSPVLKPLPASKQAIIPLGIRADKFCVADMPRKSTQGKIKLLMIGRLTFYKGHHLLLTALSELSSTAKQQFHLEIIGKGEEEARLKLLAKSLQLEDLVTFRGGVSMQELGESLRQADLLCLPSIERTEAFGVVLMEAASVGVPSLVSDVKGSGMSWVVKHQQTGVVVAANSVTSIRDELEKLPQNQQVLQHWGENSRSEFSERFDIVAVSNAVSTVYQQVLKEG